MRAGLPKREPDMLASFVENDIYGGLMEKNAGKPLFILHDGPPFPNGDIHIGTALNKILKDIIVRYKNMSGFRSPYVPGWDAHGLPIESAIIKKNKLDRKKMSAGEFRDACRAFAEDFIDRQRGQFRRLGVIGDWDRPYLTMAPEFEAEEVRVFGAMYEKGYIYKGLKPVYWCPADETALAEAEIEYTDDPCEAIFVKFKVKDDLGKLQKLSVDIGSAYFAIWTTTAWTLPGNLAVCLNPELEYSLVRAGGQTYIIASALVETVCEKAGIGAYDIAGKMTGREFELMTAEHPFYDRESLVIVGGHVTTDAGTGCVHTAPGFGADDYNVCRRYDQIGMTVPVDARGIMTADALQYEGMHYSKASAAIIEDMRASGALLASEAITHSYPHCWRCKKPIIFRATEQWFASVDAVKDLAVSACEDIAWIPAWGRERMESMIRERSDWCISRQRQWGLPIPVFYCETCHKPVCGQETIEAVAELFGERGSNAWFELDAAEILPKGYVCPHCGGEHFTKETDTLDGWFDSGSTHAAVLERRGELASPADIYLEGGDQYRGWFQSSMLTSIATRGRAPYRRVITHGWTVDGEGRAMHKSLGNSVTPEEIIREYGADILRLWVSSSDYTTDARMSKDILKQLSDIYLKIRNTARYILGNLNGFFLSERIPFDEMEPLDRWAVARLNELVRRVRTSYDNYEYHPIYHGIHNFCAVDMSSFYLDIIKDRLYCDGETSRPRRSAQSAIYTILDGLVRMLAPILAFTSEEIWAAMPHGPECDAGSVLYNDMPEYSPSLSLTPEQTARWDALATLRACVNKALELARADKRIGKSLDAEVTVYLGEGTQALREVIDGQRLDTLLIVSKVNVVSGAGPGYAPDELSGVTICVEQSAEPMCARCWTHGDGVGSDARYGDLCPRCADVVSKRHYGAEE
ncbi:MAG: isoleucine--tRNA ligase [Oscillospiraceae bacterium]|jgi:isoleucyl-tRNA synthetase|nr:isoleucine--tRNA ligase [Oscillospiraceae bacterium]